MKIRTGYVSNSSSSSFVFWGDGAKRFSKKFKDSNIYPSYDLGVNIFYWWGHDGDNIRIGDGEWKERFINGENLSGIFPEMNQVELNSTNFGKWFESEFSNTDFYEIEASDHGDTDIAERDLLDEVRHWKGSYLVFNNH